jgi:hypothetical protein
MLGFPIDVIPNWTVVNCCAVPYVSQSSEAGDRKRRAAVRELSDAMSALLYNLDNVSALRANPIKPLWDNKREGPTR